MDSDMLEEGREVFPEKKTIQTIFGQHIALRSKIKGVIIDEENVTNRSAITG